MKLSAFKFSLPDEAIAQYPLPSKEETRLMVVHRDSGEIEHLLFRDIISFFGEEDVLVVNDSKILPIKLYGYKEKTGAKVDVMLLRELDSDQHLWDTIVEPARKIRIGNKIYFGDGELVAEVVDNTTSRGRTIKLIFDGGEEMFHMLLNQIGSIPLPKQIKRPTESTDKEDYQTIFAKTPGGVVLPAEGRHFYQYLLKQLALQGTLVVPITLHIGLGELKEIDMEDLTKFKAASEYFVINQETSQRVNASLDGAKKICAVGTSVLKTIESSVSVSARLKSSKAWTNKVILSPYQFKICNSLLSNFHLPCSTSLVSLAAFGGYELIMKAYKLAIKEKYRFFVYGDAMLVI